MVFGVLHKNTWVGTSPNFIPVKIRNLFQIFAEMKPLLSFVITRKYPLRGHILGSGAPGTPGVNP